MIVRRATRPFLFPLLFLLVPICADRSLASEGPASPTRLRCEYLTSPAGIDVREPRLAWVLEHSERGQMQTAYQVLVATRPELLAQNKGDAWDSGKVVSENSTQVVYSGKPLESGRTYYWRVRYWDTNGKVSPYSEPDQFGMGFLTRAEWQGQWIGGGGLLRREVNLPEKVVRARAYVTALGYYELRINGEKVGDNVRDPAWTTYPKRVLYTTYDITRHLQPGANALGVMLSGGWWTMRISERLREYASSPALLVQITVELASGKQLTLASDTSWRTSRGPVVSDNIYNGEVYDARLEQAGWDRPGFDASGWSAAKVMEGTAGVLSAQMMPPIRVVDTLVPIALANPRPGVYVYDMGQNFSGWAQLRVSGPAGATVQMRFAELLHPDGTLDRDNLWSAKATDVYILRGEGTEVYEPRFTYHGFRYVEVTGFPGTPGLDSLRGRVVHTAVEPTGSFAASKPLLNQIQRIIRWGQTSNLQSIPTDNNQRSERLGWMGDAQLTAEEAMLNFDMAAFYTNHIRNIRDNQYEDGTVPDTVPYKYGERPADPAWGTAYPLLCWYMYQQYGDRRILEENYEGLKKYVEDLRRRAPDNLLHFSFYGDWLATEITPGELVSSAYYYLDVDILAKMADILGKTADAQAYVQLAGQIKEAFDRAYFDPATRMYANGTQTAQTLALYFGLAPKEHASRAGVLLEESIYARDLHLTTGIVGTKYLLPLLCQRGSAELAYQLATQTTYPSWGYMIANGATTVWETWQQRVWSNNHPALASVGAWFYRALGGINQPADGVGYRRLIIQPQMVRDLSSASATIETVRGTASCTWSRVPGKISLEAIIPVNSEAKIVIPRDPNLADFVIREGDRVVWENGQFVPGAAGITAAATRVDPRLFPAPPADGIVFEVGSGRYSFTLSAK